MNEVSIATSDGSCRSFVFRPQGGGPWPGVLVYMDGIGIRPAMLELGERLASHGYFVLLPDLFYRSGPYPPMNAKTVFADPDQRKTLMEKYFAFATQANIMSDSAAFFDHLASEPAVRKGRFGVTGYCMGGLMALTAAGTYPDRIAATGVFHASRLATDAPESPHHLAPKMTCRVYVAGAIEDQGFTDEMKARLERALTDGKVDHRVETYQGRHGFVFPDTPAYDQAAAERHWDTLLALFNDTLKR